MKEEEKRLFELEAVGVACGRLGRDELGLLRGREQVLGERREEGREGVVGVGRRGLARVRIVSSELDGEEASRLHVLVRVLLLLTARLDLI